MCSIRFYWITNQAYIYCSLGLFTLCVLFAQSLTTWVLLGICALVSVYLLLAAMQSAMWMNLVLSMGETRSNHWRRIQCIAAVYAVLLTLMVKLVDVLTGATFPVLNNPIWWYFAYFELVYMIGVALAAFSGKYPKSGMAVTIILWIGHSNIVMGNITWGSAESQMIASVNSILLYITVFVAVQLYLWCYIQNYSVK